MKLMVALMIGIMAATGCSGPPQRDEHEPPTDIEAALSGERLREWFSQVQAGMTEQQVRETMKSQPETVYPSMWEYVGGFAESEPYPVRNVFRIHFKDGKVVRKERSISDCIYTVPIE